MAGQISQHPFLIHKTMQSMNNPTAHMLHLKVHECMSASHETFTSKDVGGDHDYSSWIEMYDSITDGRPGEEHYEDDLPPDAEGIQCLALDRDVWDEFPDITQGDKQHKVGLYAKGFTGGWFMEKNLPYMHTIGVLQGKVRFLI
jgi:hypothetical protein